MKIITTIISFFILTTISFAGITENEQQLIDMINQAREARGLSKLEVDENISKQCRSWSINMRSYGFRHGASYECIAAGYTDAKATFRQWMNSPPHRRIIMSRSSRIGVGQHGKYWTLRVRSKLKQVIESTKTTVEKIGKDTKEILTPAKVEKVENKVSYDCSNGKCTRVETKKTIRGKTGPFGLFVW